MRATRSFSRATPPHRESILRRLAPFIQDQAFYVELGEGEVKITCEWTGISDSDIQTAVDTAPLWTPALAAKEVVSGLTLWEEAIFRVFLDLINENRAALGKSTLSAGAFFNLVKTKIDTL